MEIIDKPFYNKITKSNLNGPDYDDTIPFSDMTIKNLKYYKIQKIRFWYGSYEPSLVVNGIQLSFINLLDGSLLVTEERFGNHQLIGFQDFELKKKEYIIAAKMSVTHICSQIYFETNLGTVISTGGGKGEKYEFEVPKGNVVIGTFGGYGGHIHNFGVYSINVQNLLLARRETYIRVLRKFREKVNLNEEIKKKLQNSELKEKTCENALLISSILPKNAYLNILEFII